MIFKSSIVSLVVAVIGGGLFHFLHVVETNHLLLITISFFIVGLISSIITNRLTAPNVDNGERSNSRATEIPRQPTLSGNEAREEGEVKWFNVSKGFGFITRQSGDDIFVHYRSIRGDGHRSLSEGQKVEFVVVDGDKGLQAEDVIATTPPTRRGRR